MRGRELELGAFDELGKGTARFGESGEAVERWRVFKNEKMLTFALVCEEWEKAVTTRVCAGNVVSECQFHFSVQK